MRAFNRTRLELKQRLNTLDTLFRVPFNRTRLELKRSSPALQI